AQQLLVWPNPVHDGQIFFNRSIDACLFDQTGRMLRYTEDQPSLDLQGLASGVYILLARTGERIWIVVY
ncbi:MAG: T9SS type A sorting domain-containing protein, partial [Bacteroidota bacterium]